MSEPTHNRRASDQPVLKRLWIYFLRARQDLWLLAITGLVLYALWQNTNTVDDIDRNRLEATRIRCERSNENTIAINQVATAIQKVIVASAVLPGDRPEPPGSDPSAWVRIEPGPLSESLARTLPELPEPTLRLRAAQDTAQTIEDVKASPDDCQAEVTAARRSTR